MKSLEYSTRKVDELKGHIREPIQSPTNSNSKSISNENEPVKSTNLETVEYQDDFVRAKSALKDLQNQLKSSHLEQSKLRTEQEYQHEDTIKNLEKFRINMCEQNRNILCKMYELDMQNEELVKIENEFKGLLKSSKIDKNEIIKLKNENQNLIKNSNELNQENQDLKNNKLNLESLLEIERQEKEELKKLIQSKILDSELELDLLKSELIEVKEKLNLTEVEVEKLNVELISSETRIKSLEDELVISERNVKERINENESLRRAHQTLNQTYESTATELKEFHSAFNEMEQQISVFNPLKKRLPQTEKLTQVIIEAKRKDELEDEDIDHKKKIVEEENKKEEDQNDKQESDQGDDGIDMSIENLSNKKSMN